jgi:hypothetical protein
VYERLPEAGDLRELYHRSEVVDYEGETAAAL